jgi:cyclohexanecarboxylate-CoA ligase
MTTLAHLSASPEQARHFRERGWWRDETFLDDLARWARLRPDEPAFVTGRQGEVRVISYRELDQHVRRFAGGLTALGVGPGDVVAVQLPDWWETAALLLACLRVGAIAQPTLPDLRAREVERVLACTGAKVCVVPDRWGDHGHAEALADMAARLPRLEHRVVFGDSAATGALDFHDCLLGAGKLDESAWPSLDPDRVCLVLFTSGTTGEAKGVLHSFNTLYAGTNGITREATELSPDCCRAGPVSSRTTPTRSRCWTWSTGPASRACWRPPTGCSA